LGLLGIAAGFLVVAGPVGFLSYQTTGKATVLPHSGGVNFYIGNNPDYKETITIRPGLRWQELMELPSRQGIQDRYDRERFFVDKTVRYAAGQPLSFLQGLAYKATQFCSSREVPRNVDIYLFRKWSWLLRASVWKVGGFGFPFGVLLPLAVAGGVYWRRIIPGPIWLFMIFYPASVILVFVTSRYRVPIVPLVSVLAAGGCVAIWKILKARQSAQLMVAGVIILGAGLAGGVPGPFVAEQIDYEPELYYGLGNSLDKRARTDEGIKSYRKAISLRGDYAEAHHNVGLLLMKQEQLDEAVAHLNTAINLEPNHAVLYKDLGNALVAQGKVGDAIGGYEKAIQLDPKSAQAHRRLGLALASLGRFDAAIDHYNQALQLEPDDAQTHYSLGVALQMKGSLDEAIKQYTETLKTLPDLAVAHSNLAVIFARQGKSDQAVEHFTEALRIEPGAVAVRYNLGLVLQSKGRIEDAIEAYRKVLEIDPGHDKARTALKKLEAAPTKPPAQ
jgi:tetratricopeptide (TPR) repeat protein